MQDSREKTHVEKLTGISTIPGHSDKAGLWGKKKPWGIWRISAHIPSHGNLPVGALEDIGGIPEILGIQENKT